MLILPKTLGGLKLAEVAGYKIGDAGALEAVIDKLNEAIAAMNASPFISGTTVTPTALAATTNNWDPTGGDTGISIIRASASGGAQSVTGLAGGFPGRLFLIFNVGTSNNVTFQRDDANSLAINRFAAPTGAGAITLTPGAGNILYYDGVTSTWRCSDR